MSKKCRRGDLHRLSVGTDHGTQNHGEKDPIGIIYNKANIPVLKLQMLRSELKNNTKLN